MTIAVFASGQGSNVEAIMQAVHEGRLRGVHVSALICDRPSAPVIARAARWGVRCHLLEPKRFSSKAHYESAILTKLGQEKPDYLVLAGYMRLIGKTLLEPYANQILNIHPSLLPAFPGKHSLAEAYHYGVKVTGVTVHFVDEGIDSGPIIAQRALTVKEDDTLESLRERVHQLEHSLYPQVLQWLAEGRVSLQGRRVQVQPADS